MNKDEWAITEIEWLRAEIERLRMANERLGPWMAAALDDPNVCEAMKADIRAWLEQKADTPQ